MKFVSGPGLHPTEFIVTAVDPLAGNDSALIAVFNNAASAERLAGLLSFLESQWAAKGSNS